MERERQATRTVPAGGGGPEPADDAVEQLRRDAQGILHEADRVLDAIPVDISSLSKLGDTPSRGLLPEYAKRWPSLPTLQVPPIRTRRQSSATDLTSATGRLRQPKGAL